MWPEWTWIEKPNKCWTELRGEKGEEEDRGKIGQRPSAKTWEDWSWRGKMLSTQRRTEIYLEETHCPMCCPARDGLRSKVRKAKLNWLHCSRWPSAACFNHPTAIAPSATVFQLSQGFLLVYPTCKYLILQSLRIYIFLFLDKLTLPSSFAIWKWSWPLMRVDVHDVLTSLLFYF